MLKLRVQEILNEKDKTVYWLSKKTEIAYNNLAKLCEGETKSIRFDTLEKLCIVLECSINDLFEQDSSEHMEVEK